MIHEEKKIGKIVEELTMFFFAIGADDIHSGIRRDGRQVTIYFRSNYAPEYSEKLDLLEEYLNEPKNAGIEDIYWELAGSGDPGETSQLLLVGMMIDRAEITREKSCLKLELYKTMQD